MKEVKGQISEIWSSDSSVDEYSSLWRC